MDGRVIDKILVIIIITVTGDGDLFHYLIQNWRTVTQRKINILVVDGVDW